jgi:hypothetical protein
MDVEALIKQGAGGYASARNEAIAAAALVTGPVDRDTWDRVKSAILLADRELAQCDEAWLELRAAYLEMLLSNGKRFRVRAMARNEATHAMRAAARRYGPNHALAQRMRAARDVALGACELKPSRMKKAAERVSTARRKFGMNSRQALTAELRQVQVYRELPLPDLAADHLRRLVDRLAGDERRAAIAMDAAHTCASLGEVEAARHCFEVSYTLEIASLDEHLAKLNGDDQITARIAHASLDQNRARHLVDTGEPGEAESVLLPLLASVPRMVEQVRHRDDAQWLADIEEGALGTLADALVADGRWSQAYRTYLQAHQRVRAGRTQYDEVTAARYFNSAAYASRGWEQLS